jgi:type IV secretion system protein VirB11
VSAALSLLAMNDHEEPSLPPAAPRSVYLDAYLAPLMTWLERETVTELLVNRPGELWVEDAEQPGMQRISLPELDDQLLQRLGRTGRPDQPPGDQPRTSAARCNIAGDGARRADPDGRPAGDAAHWALAIRRHRLLDLPLDAYDRGPIAAAALAPMPDPVAEPIAYCGEAIQRRRTILISGGTSTGKTTFLNAMLREIPRMNGSCWSKTPPNCGCRAPTASA